MSRNKSFDVRAKFGAIYSASKTEKYLLKNSTIGNQLLFSEIANKKYLPSMKSEYSVLLPNDICCSLQSFAAIALKTKKL